MCVVLSVCASTSEIKPELKDLFYNAALLQWIKTLPVCENKNYIKLLIKSILNSTDGDGLKIINYVYRKYLNIIYRSFG